MKIIGTVEQSMWIASNPEIYEYSTKALDHCDSVISKTVGKICNTVGKLDKEDSISTTEAINLLSKYNALIREVSVAKMHILADKFCKCTAREQDIFFGGLK
jgi:hypothetical protein